MAQIPLVKLGDGNDMPILAYGLGSANMNGQHEEVVNVTLMAIRNGYYHLDGAEVYGNEAALGEAIELSGLPRNKLFVTTKILGGPGQDVQASFDASLQKLGLDYIDLYLIHLPFLAPGELPLMWTKLEAIKLSGKAKSIGVSNFLQKHLEIILKTAKIPPAVNQIEYHPYLQHGKLIQFCHENRIAVSAYSTLAAIRKARPGPVDHIYARLAEKYAVSEGEVAIKWCIDQGLSVITTSGSEQRLQKYKTNMANFNLSVDEIKQISEVGQQKHYRDLYNDHFAADDKS
ncbi:Aldo/keto reductase [Whalleya microplaca]|nr:Aldo/keto reductase [Whalleya microplaca]